jgi:N12 class adenine-specific DNA methylase/SAM-dependent methyltransferase
VVPRFRPRGQEDLAPSSPMARVRANLEALATLRQIEREGRPPTPAEQAVLARWSGWGAVPEVFNPARRELAWARERLAELLGPEEWRAVARSTLNAHYTDAALVQVIWEAARGLGFAGGRVLEPGCGSGNFIGLAPEGARMVGVELEPVTAAIARALYPDAEICHESFADHRALEGSYDLVVGNVPFGRVVLHDRRHNPSGHAIHNHFILKSLHLTRPGGLVLLLTSRWTLDARNPAARREMAELADLVGVVRLPGGAHRRAAGTEVVTDLVVLRRREPGRPPAGEGWELARPLGLPGGEALVNEHFHRHPEDVLGELSVGHGLHGPEELLVTAHGPAAPALAEALGRLVERARREGLPLGPPAKAAAPAVAAPGWSERPEGYLEVRPTGGFTEVVGGRAVPYPVPASQAAELRELLGLRDAVLALLDAEAASRDDTPELERLRRELNRRYDAYLRRWGPINRFSWRPTGRHDPETGEPRLARVRPRQGGFRSDPFANLVYALERFDPITQRATKADIFRERVVAPRAPRLGADTPEDALAICLDTHGRVELAEIARLLGVDEAQARQALGGLVFEEPGTGRLVPQAEYLSGNVRRKLAAAEEAAREDPRFEVNVAALRRVLPRDLGPEEISARLGAAWIDASYVERFLRETLEDPELVVEHPGGSVWAVRGRRWGVLSTSRWGTPRCPAPAIAQALLEQRQIRVYDETPDGARVLNLAETAAAQAKAEELAGRFSEWVWEDPERAAELARTYNQRFNAIVLRSYDDARPSLPGLALTFRPHPHQLAAVARIVAEPAVGLYHEVGAGKTAEMVMGCMELRRLGLVRKPAIVVPNHMLEQFSREFLQLYPRARILVCHKEDLERERRRLFIARCATGNWDAVIVTESAFQRLPMSPEAQRRYLEREVEAIEAQLVRARAESGLTVKRLQQAKLQAEERMRKLLDTARDPGVTFEQTGIDYLFRDEGHRDKNLRTHSNLPGVGIEGSQRATDMHMKLSYLRERHPARWGTRATATPVANSMAELYTEMRYLRPDLLEEAGIEDFDQWAATFGEVVSAVEVAPDGSGLRLKARFARFTNVPELLRIFHVFGDVKTGQELQLPAPPLAPRPEDGRRTPETVVVPPSPELEAFMAELAQRAERVRGGLAEKGEDNLLSIATAGRLAALDLRLVGRSTTFPSKVEVAAERIAAIWAEHRERTYRGPDGEPHPVPGALQIVFCDLGTPRPGEWNVYEELRSQLAARGLPREAIRFIHEAGDDREKAELFAACREGRVAVLVGSTERMGVGTNVQDRAVALHHLDCPWRPADLHQREGRILRQGNQNPEVRILRYVTEGSFDGFVWGTVERKASFIAQVMRGRLDVREIEDVGDVALSYQEVKAIATGNPLLIEQAEAEAELTRLERLERAHARAQAQLRWSMEASEREITETSRLIAQAEAALSRRIDTRGEAFAMVVQGEPIARRAEAEARLRAVLAGLLARGSSDGRPVEVGSLGGFAVTAADRGHDGRPAVIVRLEEVPGAELRLSPRELAEASVVSRLEHRLAGLERLRDEAAQRRERAREELARARELAGKPFPQAEWLAAARERVRAITEELERMASGTAEAARETATAELHASDQQADVADSVDVVEATSSHQAGR